MSRFHTTISRRDFMKALGVAGAGLGAAAATAPVFHDLDEMASSPQAQWKRPWYVKEVDKPTTEVDWSQKKMWSEVNTLRGSGKYMDTYIDKAEQDNRNALKAEKHTAWLASARPGYSQKDVSLAARCDAQVQRTFRFVKCIAPGSPSGASHFPLREVHRTWFAVRCTWFA